MASKDPLAVVIGRSVRSAAARSDVKLASLADRVGLAPNSMSRRINGHLPFTWPELVRVSDALDIDLSEILEDAERTAAKVAASADRDAQSCEIEGAA